MYEEIIDLWKTYEFFFGEFDFQWFTIVSARTLILFKKVEDNKKWLMI